MADVAVAPPEAGAGTVRARRPVRAPPASRSGSARRAPRISWTVRTERARVGAAGLRDPHRATRRWSCGTPAGSTSADSVLVAWPAEPLPSRARRPVSVRVWGAGDDRSERVERAVAVETGLLEPADWTAQLISADEDRDPEVDQPPALFRREFDARRGRSPRPGCTSPRTALSRPRSTATASVRTCSRPAGPATDTGCATTPTTSPTCCVTGANAIGATVADGWFRGHIGFEGGLHNIYGDRVGLLAQLEIRYADGTSADRGHRRQLAVRAPARSPRPGIYPGETYDARLEQPGWSAAGFDDSGWGERAGRAAADRHVLVAPDRPAGRAGSRRSRRSPSARSPSGRTLVDFGQNLVGRLRIRVSGSAGHDRDPPPRRGARARRAGHPPAAPAPRPPIATPCAATDVEKWEPRFTFHGFRYAEIDGWPGELTADDLRAVVLHTDMTRTGWFSCSDALLNRLHENVVWGMRGNFLDVPTDCPQRDERLGWTGDIQVFAPTARFLYDCTGMLGLLARRRGRRTAGARHGAGVCAVHPSSQFPTDADRGLGRRRGRRAVDALPAGRRSSTCSAASTRACGPGWTRSPMPPATTICGTPACNWVTGSIPTAPPDRPGRRPDRPRSWSPPPTTR